MVVEIKEKNLEIVERVGYGYKNMERLDLTIDEIIVQFEEEHRKYKNVVREVLEYYPISRNNDFILHIEVLRALQLVDVTSGKENFSFKIKRDNIKKIISSETISRCRRSLISDALKRNDWDDLKLLLPTNDKVLNRRMLKDKALRMYFREQKNG